MYGCFECANSEYTKMVKQFNCHFHVNLPLMDSLAHLLPGVSKTVKLTF